MDCRLTRTDCRLRSLRSLQAMQVFNIRPFWFVNSATGFREAHDVHVFSMTKHNEIGRCSWLRHATDAMSQ